MSNSAVAGLNGSRPVKNKKNNKQLKEIYILKIMISNEMLTQIQKGGIKNN